MYIDLIFINFARIKNAIFVSFYLDSRAALHHQIGKKEVESLFFAFEYEKSTNRAL